MPVAIITGGSKGLGLALATELTGRGWSVVIDARRAGELDAARKHLPAERVIAVAGDVTEARHRNELVEAARRLGGLDLLVNNASTLGPSPLRELLDLDGDELRRIYEVNVLAPLALTKLALELLEESDVATVFNVSSDAAVEHYETWGGYGSSKAALDHLSGTLGRERPKLRVLAVDPGDMRTEMHQAAFPGEDISDRPLPSVVAPKIVELVVGGAPSGRYRAQSVASEAGFEPVGDELAGSGAAEGKS
jgi:NAD(P)-dependent dehydrogenase (short-subunit alcohol dehydrogenase family)